MLSQTKFEFCWQGQPIASLHVSPDWPAEQTAIQAMRHVSTVAQWDSRLMPARGTTGLATQSARKATQSATATQQRAATGFKPCISMLRAQCQHKGRRLQPKG